ncbi:zinc finger protein 184-like isoform X2 [Myxocyprinus asiaticus]|uniref:zinc finger protein 184-like isoform X2 n=1 Tax=Myxocyprinus asiaticus TaxID=70543 RepID=UPI002222FD53|nr:zinc finger protein 184-like isoform X2 [Myxocyprinus asiaticus]
MAVLTLQRQIASVMEVLANAAVAEICRLVEGSFAELQLEISQRQKENSLLKKKLKTIEIRESFYRRAHKLKCASTDMSTTSVHGKVPERIVRVKVSLNNERSDGEGSSDSLQPETLDQSVGDEEPDVPIIKEERTDNIRSKQSDREARITENHKEDTQYRNAGVSGTVNRDNFTDHNTDQHCHKESSGMQTDLLKDENPEMNVTDEDTHILSDESRMERQSDGDAQTNLQSVTFYASWDSRRFEATTNNPSYTEAECNAESSVNQYFMYRGSADPICSYATQIDSNGLSVPDVDGHVPHSDDAAGPEKAAVSQSELSPYTPRFSFKQSDTPHMHRKDKFMCKHCGKAFSQPNTLLLHQKLHARERLHSCTLCGKRFSHPSRLKRHQSIHMEEKPFRCLHCGKQFSDPSNLKKHVNVHTGEKPYGCSQCGKMFNQSSNLKTHMKIHTREKPFGCELCGKTFAYKYSLVKHQQRNCMSQLQ